MKAPEPLVIHSYRTVFSFERRLYRIDRWRLPVRGGVPLRALLYVPLAYALIALVSALPLAGPAVDALAPPVRWGLIPLALVGLALRTQLDGRPAHRALFALTRWVLEPRWLAGLRRCPAPGGRVALTGALIVRPDWRGSAYRPGRLRGPARVLLRAPAALDLAGDRLLLAPAPGAPLRHGRVVELPAGTELVLR